MRIGAVYPQTEYGNDPAAILDYARTAEALGYTHVLAYDHVLGANPNRPGGWTGPYTHLTPFQEPFVLFAYMAAVTTSLEFATGIIILPQRQTALVAKQAATLDVLSGGRQRLGIGIGWNEVEYVALNENFHDRGKRVEEQVELMRRLWTEELITYKSKQHEIQDAGLNPLPVQRPIPLWFGGGGGSHSDKVIHRIARLADGWMTPGYRTMADAAAALDRLDHALAEAGRTRAGFGIEPRLNYGDGSGDRWRESADGWRELGATHLTINTMGCGFDTPEKHLAAIRQMAQVLL